MLKSLIAVAALITVSASAAVAAPLIPIGVSNQNASAETIVTPARSLRIFKKSSGPSVYKKSARQKCLDMMLPQDGADCMKKLKAKKNN